MRRRLRYDALMANQEAAQAPDAEFNFEVFDKRATAFVKRPEVTVQSKGVLSINASAHHLLGQPDTVELLYDRARRVVGVRPVAPETAHAYPIRNVGAGRTFVISGRAFFQYYEIATERPIRRDAKMVNGVLVIDLNDPGRDATSNRARAKLKNASGAGPNGTAPTTSPGSSSYPAESQVFDTKPGVVGEGPDS